MSRRELAEAVNAYLCAETGKVFAMSANHVGKLEQGVIGAPIEEYRRGLRAVLGAATDAELGFDAPRPPTLTVDDPQPVASHPARAGFVATGPETSVRPSSPAPGRGLGVTGAGGVTVTVTVTPTDQGAMCVGILAGDVRIAIETAPTGPVGMVGHPGSLAAAGDARIYSLAQARQGRAARTA